MRLFTIFVATFVPTTALADGALPPLDVPAQCADVATAPASATVPQPALGARISLATCQAELRFDKLHLAPDDASIAAMNDAAAQSFALLDQVIQSNDPELAPIAQRAKTDLHVAMAVRMRNSIPAITMTTVGQALADHDQAHAALEPKLHAWLGGN